MAAGDAILDEIQVLQRLGLAQPRTVEEHRGEQGYKRGYRMFHFEGSTDGG
jgi:hypothetical protein